MIKLAIVCTHPIQYFAPVFKALAAHELLDVRVFYGWKGASENAFDPGFGVDIRWDIPLLDGYEYEFVDNLSKDPGSHHFRGIDLPSLCERIEQWQADAILIYGWSYKAHLSAMRHFKGRVPVYFRGDSTLLDEKNNWKRTVRRAFLKWVYRHVDCAFAVGTNNSHYFIAHGLLRDQVVHAPHAVDNLRFSDPTGEAEQRAAIWRKQLGIQPQDICLLFAGKLELQKAPELLAQAVKTCTSKQFKLIFAGSGPLEGELRKITDPQRCYFIGFQNQTQMPCVYRLADALILPSRSETWGLALNEAMACGRAVIASDRVGAAIDLVQPGVNGWITAADDSSSLKASLTAALAIGRSGLKDYGNASRKIIQDWTIFKQVDAITWRLRRDAQQFRV